MKVAVMVAALPGGGIQGVGLLEAREA